ncbi:MAG: acyltransferase [Bacteroidales bacterium]|nr:acyltransferase [Bacteroidales bacterium]
MEKERIVFADYLRVLACFLVMLVHASENFYGADTSGLAGSMSMLATEANRFWVAFYDGFIARTCVPLFMVLSAFLLVPMKPGDTMLGFYRRRFLRILPPVACFMLIYCFLPLAWGGMTWEQSLADLKLIPWNFPSMAGHLWFIYPLISLYLIIPVVSPWLEKAGAREELVFLGIFFVSTFLPFIHRFITPEVWGECFWNGFTMLWYCSGYLGYLVLAHYIRFHLDWDRGWRLRVGAICFLAGAAFTGWSFWYKGTPGTLIETPALEWAWEFCTPNVLVATFGMFLMFSAMRRTLVPSCIVSLSRMSFGMYLMHLLYLAPIAKLVIGGDVANPLLPVWAAIPVIAVATFICCAVTTKILSYIPGSKWVIGV